MTPIDTRIQIKFACVQLQATELVEADLKLPAGDFAKLSHANDRCREGKMFVHKCEALVEKRNGEQTKGLMQSAVYDSDKSNGKAELKELLDCIKQTVLERMYDEVSDSIITK